jgi:hypothetical protein
LRAKVKGRKAGAAENFCEPEADAHVLTWEEVSRTHRVRNGVYHRGGRLVSLLTDFGRINPCYPDALSEDGESIVYTGEGRHGDQHLSPGNRALLSAVESGHAVPLFNKLGVGRWQLTGRWRVASAEHRFDERERRMLWRFTLRRVGATTECERRTVGRKPNRI